MHLSLSLSTTSAGRVAGPTGPDAPIHLATGSKTIAGTYFSGSLASVFGGILTAGDLLLLVIETANYTLELPTGWTQLASSPQGTGTEGGADATSLTVFYHVWNGTDDPSGVVSIAGQDHQVGALMAFRGVDGAAPINATAGAVDTDVDTTIEWPSVTTTSDNCLVLLIEAHALPDSNTNGQTSGQTNANLTGLTEIVDYNTAGGNGGGMSVAGGVMATAGATGVSTGTAAVASKKGVITLALAPVT